MTDAEKEVRFWELIDGLVFLEGDGRFICSIGDKVELAIVTILLNHRRIVRGFTGQPAIDYVEDMVIRHVVGRLVRTPIVSPVHAATGANERGNRNRRLACSMKTPPNTCTAG